ncbi:MAG: UDP-3-O-(3-hydroxymyristoyl)glucosamine N-acyltransferase [Akkermansiaceae bacterium]|nr:UDP-3-O-(3-hydroxymyristoyl)glucosamine N-acyltransferase [Akkermansiaceae bacterium]
MNLSIDKIVTITSGKIVQSGESHGFSGVASLDEATAQDVSFLGNEKYYQAFMNTGAGIVLIPPGVPDRPESVTLIEVENPSIAFGEIVKFFVNTKKIFTPGVHPAAHVAADVQLDPGAVCVKAGAIIESGAIIGNGTEIGPGVVIGERSQIGEDCMIYANCTVREECVLGDRVILQPGCVIGADGYGYELLEGKHVKIDQVGIVELCDDVEVGANTTIDRARFGKTKVGKGTKIDNLTQIAHNVQIGEHTLVVAQVGLAGSSKIGNYVTLAAQSGCVGHINIADKATLAARTVATKDIPTGGGVYMGMPARPMREEMKKMALISRLPALVAEVKRLGSKCD